MRIASLVFMAALLAFPASAESIRSKLFGIEAMIAYSRSMEPSIRAGEYVLIDTKVFQRNELKPGYVIAYRNPKYENNVFIMRVAATAGDILEIKGGKTFLNGQEVDESYVKEENRREAYSLDMDKVEIPSGHVFVLGDNRDISNDSRFTGAVKVGDVVGLVTQAKESWLKGEFRIVQ